MNGDDNNYEVIYCPEDGEYKMDIYSFFCIYTYNYMSSHTFIENK